MRSAECGVAVQRRKPTNVKRGWHKCGVEDEVEERWNSAHDMACASFCQCFFFFILIKSKEVIDLGACDGNTNLLDAHTLVV